ncbi:MAG: aldehyde dehydrogenase family protein [Candidatus Saganbacteria bacterium]|nr:aldehyde dehydrogenase family protein [Candidatus Saganbacteria bacterium]
MKMRVINPATEKVREVQETPINLIPSIVDRARTAYEKWKELTVKNRAKIILGLCRLISKKQRSLAEVISSDMGKSLRDTLRDVERTPERIRFFCKKAPVWIAPDRLKGGAIEFHPLGVIVVFSPSLSPFVAALQVIIPALLAGNAVVAKPSECCPFTGMEIQKLFDELADLPKGLFQTVLGTKEHGKALLRQNVDMICFTGSSKVGKDIMKGSAHRLHRLQMELGGLDAAIVLKDADIKKTAKTIVSLNSGNTGQFCCTIRRVYVEREIYEDFVKAAARESEKITFGDPFSSARMGPLATKAQLERVLDMVEDAKRKGAKIVTGGKRPKKKGFYFPSTILTGVDHDMRVMREESAGPLLPIYPVKGWREAVKCTNDTRYGLSGSVWTKNYKLGKKIARQLDVGVSRVNGHGACPVGLPFGGTKESGMGRIRSKEGMRELTNAKLIHVAKY